MHILPVLIHEHGGVCCISTCAFKVKPLMYIVQCGYVSTEILIILASGDYTVTDCDDALFLICLLYLRTCMLIRFDFALVALNIMIFQSLDETTIPRLVSCGHAYRS